MRSSGGRWGNRVKLWRAVEVLVRGLDEDKLCEC